MRILAIDPGAKAGYVMLDTATELVRRRLPRAVPALPLVVDAWRACPSTPADVIVGEAQWLARGKDPTDILELARRAGWQMAVAVRQCQGIPHWISPVRGWREALQSNKVPKRVLISRAEASLSPVESDILRRAAGRAPTSMRDLCEAVMIGWGWYLQPTRPWTPPP